MPVPSGCLDRCGPPTGCTGLPSEPLGLDRSYVSRIMRLALIAPDIVETIVNGREPSGLSLERLVREMPMGWAEQWERLAML